MVNEDKTSAIQLAQKALDKAYGKGSLIWASDENAFVDVESISTGSINTDIATGIGGFPRGRISEIYGPESSGKTTLTLHTIANCQASNGVAAFIDAEHALDLNYAEKLGVRRDRLLISQPTTAEEALNIIDTVATSGSVDLIILDSVAALIPKSELEGNIGDSQPGLQARLMGQTMRKITSRAHKTNTAVIFINQIRYKIGVMFGNPETVSGGQALKFYASLRLDIRTIKREKDKGLSRTRIKIVKNKCAPPFREAEFDIKYGEGVDRLSEYFDAAIQKGILNRKGPYYYYGEERIGQGKDQTLEYIKEHPEFQHLVITGEILEGQENEEDLSAMGGTDTGDEDNTSGGN